MEVSRFLEARSGIDPPPALSSARWIDPPAAPDVEHVGGFLPIVRTIGERTAELHLALREARARIGALEPAQESIDPGAFTQAVQRGWDEVRGHLTNYAATADGRVAELARDLQAAGPSIVEGIQRASSHLDGLAAPIPLHGRLELPRILIYESEIAFIDPASDPNTPPEERLRPRSPVRDLATVLWSLSVAARLAAETRSATMPPPHDRLFGWARYWAAWMGATFLASYRARAGTLVATNTDVFRHELTLHLLATGFRDIDACAGHGPARVALALATGLDVFDERQP
jgi:maltose alpha-D-glucosyltransferase/alpha-amylase